MEHIVSTTLIIIFRVYQNLQEKKKHIRRKIRQPVVLLFFFTIYHILLSIAIHHEQQQQQQYNNNNPCHTSVSRTLPCIFAASRQLSHDSGGHFRSDAALCDSTTISTVPTIPTLSLRFLFLVFTPSMGRYVESFDKINTSGVTCTPIQDSSI